MKTSLTRMTIISNSASQDLYRAVVKLAYTTLYLLGMPTLFPCKAFLMFCLRLTRQQFQFLRAFSHLLKLWLQYTMHGGNVIHPMVHGSDPLDSQPEIQEQRKALLSNTHKMWLKSTQLNKIALIPTNYV